LSENQKIKMVMILACLTFIFTMSLWVKSIIKDIVLYYEGNIFYADGVIEEKYETNGFLGQSSYSFKIKYGKNHYGIYNCTKENYLLLDKGQSLKVILRDKDYKIINIAWDEAQFKRYIEKKKVLKYTD